MYLCATEIEGYAHFNTIGLNHHCTMIASKRANDPVWTSIYAYAQLPAELARLEELAHNLWWVWNPRAHRLYKALSPELWESTEGNPVMLLRQLSSEDIQRITTDAALMAELEAVYARL